MMHYTMKIAFPAKPFLVLLLVITVSSEGVGSEWLKGAFRVNSEVSAGKNSFEDIAAIAVDSDFDFVVFTDQFIVRGEYGLPPFRNVIRYVKNRRSILTYGIKNYLEGLATAQKRFPEVVLIPGADVAPIYYWTGSPFDKASLQGHRWSQQLTVLGSRDEAFYRGLPVIHNDPLGVEFPDTVFKLAPLLLVLLAYVIIRTGNHSHHHRHSSQSHGYQHGGHSHRHRHRRKPRKIDKRRIMVSVALCLLAVLWLADNRIFHLINYSQYEQHGIEPFQNLIDYVNEHDALAFWSHPEMTMESTYGPFLSKKYGKVVLHTKSYLADVVATFGHNGLAGLYGDTSTAHLSGNEWDYMLSEYCNGERRVRPVTVGEVDYHADRRLDFIVTYVEVEQNSEDAILKALKNGNSYAIGGAATQTFRLTGVSLSAMTATAGLGETLHTDSDTAILKIRGEWRNAAGEPSPGGGGTAFLNVNGKLIGTRMVSGPSFDIAEEIMLNEEPLQYVRFYMKLSNGNLVANPIFLERVVTIN